jgi:hypothetical protein
MVEAICTKPDVGQRRGILAVRCRLWSLNGSYSVSPCCRQRFDAAEIAALVPVQRVQMG